MLGLTKAIINEDVNLSISTISGPILISKLFVILHEFCHKAWFSLNMKNILKLVMFSENVCSLKLSCKLRADVRRSHRIMLSFDARLVMFQVRTNAVKCCWWVSVVCACWYKAHDKKSARLHFRGITSKCKDAVRFIQITSTVTIHGVRNNQKTKKMPYFFEKGIP